MYQKSHILKLIRRFFLAVSLTYLRVLEVSELEESEIFVI
jgi:hypothetical protein